MKLKMKEFKKMKEDLNQKHLKIIKNLKKDFQKYQLLKGCLKNYIKKWQ